MMTPRPRGTECDLEMGILSRFNKRMRRQSRSLENFFEIQRFAPASFPHGGTLTGEPCPRALFRSLTASGIGKLGLALGIVSGPRADSNKVQGCYVLTWA